MLGGDELGTSKYRRGVYAAPQPIGLPGATDNFQVSVILFLNFVCSMRTKTQRVQSNRPCNLKSSVLSHASLHTLVSFDAFL